jgi:hypothetical protein
MAIILASNYIFTIKVKDDVMHRLGSS